MRDTHQSIRGEALQALIQEDAFCSVFQPIVDLRTGSNIAHEALSRLPHDAPFENISDVFDVAQKEGLLWELERATRRVALNAAANWPDNVLLFLNSTPTVVTDDRFENAILQEIDQTAGLSPERIVLEITERAETDSENILSQRLLRLKTLGFRIAIDDVGAGVNGLNRMMALRPHWLKLDRELISHINEDPYKQNLVDFFVNFSKHSGVGLIVEGIEREHELRTLIDLGAKSGQGYLLGKPNTTLASITPEVGDLITRRAAIVSGRHRLAAQAVFVEQFTRDACCCDGEKSVRAVAEDICDSPLLPGVLVMNNTQALGWVPRQIIHAHAQDPHAAEQPIKNVATPFSSASIDSASPLTEALSQLACREDMHKAMPLVVSHAGRVTGVLHLGDLFIATARMVADTRIGLHPITGLPIRSHCDRVFIEAAKSNTIVDAIFVDIQGFHTFNEQIGYDAGDLMLRILAGILISAAPMDSDHEIVGHLGDDRFLILLRNAAQNNLCQNIVTEFEDAMERLTLPGAPQSQTSCLLVDRPPLLGLRIVHVESASSRVSLPSELTRLIAQTKSTASESQIGGRSTLVHLPKPALFKKSA